MTIRKAFEAVKSKFYIDEGELYLVSCLDFGDFWGFGFSLVPREKCGVCYGYDIVLKADGKISVFNPWNDKDGINLMNNAIKIPIDEVLQGESKYTR